MLQSNEIAKGLFPKTGVIETLEQHQSYSLVIYIFFFFWQTKRKIILQGLSANTKIVQE